ncbi:proline-rich receptor-like protein kinase PERK2 [Portunus trituberculatus]|uniref:proline-rich receptor-like protein kinase PERK2 n=1 Tax=Portunus trituberculatus TaxID=210409 RepID=UPI001E1CF62D|nr:proline-rich receptor-like protein kinase PERK2 [Portunus trituberculatus]
MVAALHVTLKEEMSSMKALLMELASQTKITSQATAAPGPSTHMDVDDTPQQTKIPAQHKSKPLPRGEASNTTDQATLRKDNTNDDLINHAHLPPALPSSPPLHSTSPPQQLPQQPPHLSANTKQALPPQHSTTSKDLANDKHLPPAPLSLPPPLSISLPQEPPRQPPHPSANITQQPYKTLSEHSNKILSAHPQFCDIDK